MAFWQAKVEGQAVVSAYRAPMDGSSDPVNDLLMPNLGVPESLLFLMFLNSD
ncbi:hypothetical protein [Marinagarivorans algicola]|uniref:hypothetical protein n=1 Tax=Marinagarivorans algicola TaxID=1513270 RepID=UPI0012E138C7|nr:hypothetical protein [Marinagarivorans algicola]